MPRWAIIGAPDRDGAALPADDEGRFRRYARAWVGRVWLRLAPVLVALALLSGVAAPKTVALAAAVLVAGEALDGIVLWRLGGRAGADGRGLGRALPAAISATTLTAALQAATLAYAAAVLVTLGGAPGAALAAVACLVLIGTAAGQLGAHRPAAIARIAIAGGALALLALDLGWRGSLPMPAAALGVLAVVWALMALLDAARLIRQGEARSALAAALALRAEGEVRRANAAAAEARDLAQRLTAVAESVGDVVFIVDEKGAIVWVNAAFTRATGYGADEAVGRAPAFLCGPETDPARIREIERCLTRHRRCEVRVAFHHRSGRALWLDLEVTPIVDSGGALRHMIAVGQDVTEFCRQTLALDEARHSADEAALMRDLLVASIGPDLAVPLAGILGASELLAEGFGARAEPGPDQPGRNAARPDRPGGRRPGEAVPGPGQAALFGALDASAGALADRIENLIDLARLASGSFSLAEAPFCLRDCLSEAVAGVAAVAAAKGLPLQLLLPSSLPEQVLGDARRLRQVVRILLGNAVKFTETGQIRVEVSVRLEDGHCAIELLVRDTGIGISAARVAGLFDLRPPAATGGSAGAGLPLAHLLLRAMGGQITASSLPGAGSVFRVALALAIVSAASAGTGRDAEAHGRGVPANVAPTGVRSGRSAVPPDRVPASAAAASPVPGDPAAAADPDGEPLAGARVLIAAADRTELVLLEAMLARAGAYPILATNGREAVSLCRANPPDLVVLDVGMPICDGVAAVREIRALEAAGQLSRSGLASLPVMAIAGATGPNATADLEAAGITEVLVRPVSRPTLVAALAAQLDRLRLASPPAATPGDRPPAGEASSRKASGQAA